MQHLNLCSQLDRTVEPPFSARQQLWAVASTTVLMLLIYVVLVIGSGSYEDELKTLTQRQNSMSQELDQLKARKAQLQKDRTLDNEIIALKNDLKFRRQLLASIDPESSDVGSGFAKHLGGLARQHVDGLWFTQIQLTEGGQQLALLGSTRQPEYVPQYLQKLSSEEVFAGHQFRVLRMSITADRTDILNFELRAYEVTEP